MKRNEVGSQGLIILAIANTTRAGLGGRGELWRNLVLNKGEGGKNFYD